MPRSNPHERHMAHRVAIQADAGAGRTVRGAPADDWRTVAEDVPCLVATGSEAMDDQSPGGREAAEDVRRYRVAFTNPPEHLGRNHRLVWDAGPPIGVRLLGVSTALVPDPAGRLWTCMAEDRGQPPPE